MNDRIDTRRIEQFAFNFTTTRRTELVPGRLYRFAPWNKSTVAPICGNAIPGETVGKLLGFRELDPNTPIPEDDDAFPENPIAVLMPVDSDDEEDEIEVDTLDLLPV